MKLLSKYTTPYIVLGTLAVFLPSGGYAYASADTFCETFDATQASIEQKKTERIDALRDIQSRHETRLGESRKNFSVLASAYQVRKVSPLFTESTKRSEIAKVEALQMRLDRAQTFFDDERTGMNTVLARITELEQEAFAEARDACASGVPSSEVAQVFQEDMAEIQSVVHAHAEKMKQRKESIGTLRESAPETSFRSRFNFFNSQRIRN